MGARQLLSGASFGPEAVKLMGRVFDDAWGSIAGNFGDPLVIEAARLRLANTILSLASEASEENLEAASLKEAALQALARGYQAPRPSI
jgi:hypothetical protein